MNVPQLQHGYVLVSFNMNDNSNTDSSCLFQLKTHRRINSHSGRYDDNVLFMPTPECCSFVSLASDAFLFPTTDPSCFPFQF